MVERDEKGRIKKGQSLNPTGIDRRKAMMLRDLEALTPRAIARLGTLLDSDQPAIALASAKEILNRNLGTPRAVVDVSVQHSIGAQHMAALRELADKARAAQSNMIDVTPAAYVSIEPALTEIVESAHVLSTDGSQSD